MTPGAVTITATRKAEAGHAEDTASYILYITIKPADKAALIAETGRAMKAHGNKVNLNYIDTSGIIDMRSLFSAERKYGNGLGAFNGDISKWDVSQVTNMFGMFEFNTAFNQDISDWNVSKVTDMRSMFYRATAFNQDISDWNVSKVTDMRSMFNGATSFKHNLDAWGSRINAAVKADRWSNAIFMFTTGSGLAISLPSWCETEPDCKGKQ